MDLNKLLEKKDAFNKNEWKEATQGITISKGLKIERLNYLLKLEKKLHKAFQKAKINNPLQEINRQILVFQSFAQIEQLQRHIRLVNGKQPISKKIHASFVVQQGDKNVALMQNYLSLLNKKLQYYKNLPIEKQKHILFNIMQLNADILAKQEFISAYSRRFFKYKRKQN